MAKCGCASGACSCKFEDSTDVEWSGSGIKSDPFVATPVPLVFADDTSTLALTLDVSDNVATLSAQPLLSSNVQTFTADGTWTKPGGVTFVRVTMISGGGGGAAGSTTGSQSGGGGGDAGQVANFTLIGVEIPASAAVVVGQGGAGGATTSSVGLAGDAGGDTEFGAHQVRGGVGGAPLSLAGTHLAAGNPPGQQAEDHSAAWNPAHYYLAPGAGGIGQGTSTAARPGGYSHPGQGSRFPGDTGGGAINGNGRNEPVTKMGGGGGGGAIGEDGGNGGNYGGGGGGGGGGTFGPTGPTAPGVGGNGADGYVQVISW